MASSQEGNASSNSDCSRALNVIIHTSSILQLLANLCDGGGGGGGGGAVVSCIDLNSLIFNAISDTKAAIRLKHGACPDFTFTPSLTASQVSCCCVPSWVSFSIIELLKNSAISHIHKFGGAAGVEDGPSIQIGIDTNDESFIHISIIDYGVGIQSKNLNENKWNWGDSKNIKRSIGEANEPNYGYSRDFGPPVSSHGIGLARVSICINSLHAGTFSLENRGRSGEGVQAKISIPRNGMRIIDPLPQLVSFIR